MSLAHEDKPKQSLFSPDLPARTTPPLVPLDPEYVFSVNDPGPALDEDGPEALGRINADGPACCSPGFCRKASALLDALHLAKDVISDAIAIVEEETLP